MNQSDLIEGEFYQYNRHPSGDIYIFQSAGNNCYKYRVLGKEFASSSTFGFKDGYFSIATPENKLYLQQCITNNGFIENFNLTPEIY